MISSCASMSHYVTEVVQYETKDAFTDSFQYQSKSITPVDEYKCNLSQDLIDILENEFRETEAVRNQGITALREWTMQNHRIVLTRLDSIWLLKHLRFKKHSIPAAQEAIERHLVLRQGVYGHIYFHNDSDVLRPSVKQIFDVNPVCILPDRDKYGRPVVFFRLKNVKPDSSPTIFQDITTALKLFTEGLSEIEEFHIRGVVYIIDMSGIGAAHIKVVPIENMIKIAKNGEKCVVGRHKGIHVVNLPSAVNFMFNLLLTQAPPKLRERVKVYKSFDQLDCIDKKSLPLEYGGTIPMKEMSKSLWNLLLEKRDLHKSYTEMLVNEKMYPKACFEGSIAMLKIPLSSESLFEDAKHCCDESIYGVQGSFRKLEID